MKVRRVVRVLAIVFIMGSVLAGCGGGSVGTGGERTIEGKLLRSGKPIPDIEVTVMSGSESVSTTTNEEGQFSVESSMRTESLKLTFLFSQQMIEANLKDIPPDASVVKMQCSYDDKNTLVKIDSVQYVTTEEK